MLNILNIYNGPLCLGSVLLEDWMSWGIVMQTALCCLKSRRCSSADNNVIRLTTCSGSCWERWEQDRTWHNSQGLGVALLSGVLIKLAQSCTKEWWQTVSTMLHCVSTQCLVLTSLQPRIMTRQCCVSLPCTLNDAGDIVCLGDSYQKFSPHKCSEELFVVKETCYLLII